MTRIKSIAEFNLIKCATKESTVQMIKKYQLSPRVLTWLVNSLNADKGILIAKAIINYQELNTYHIQYLINNVLRTRCYCQKDWSDNLANKVNEQTMLYLLEESTYMPSHFIKRWLTNRKGRIGNIELLQLIINRFDLDEFLAPSPSQMRELHEEGGVHKITLRDIVIGSSEISEIDDDLYHFLGFDTDRSSASRLLDKRKVSREIVMANLHSFCYEDVLYRYKLDRKSIDKVIRSYSDRDRYTNYSRLNILKVILRTQTLTDTDIEEIIFMKTSYCGGLWDDRKYQLIDIFEYQSPSEDFIQKWTSRYSTSTMWRYISRNKKLSLKFLIENKDKIHWNEVYAYKPLRPKQIKALVDRGLVHWGNLSKYQKINMELYNELKSNLKHKNLITNSNLPSDVKELVKKKMKMLKALAR